MEIKLLFFGQITDIIGVSTLEIKELNSTDALKLQLENQFPVLQTVSYAIAVNKKIIQENTTLIHNDTVALLPPFSGG